MSTTTRPLTLEQFCARHKITATCVYGAPEREQGQTSEWKRTATPWTVTLRLGRRRITTGFWQGSAHAAEPTAADVLGCLMLDASSAEQCANVDEWLDQYGPSASGDKVTIAAVREAEASYRACVKLAPRLRRFLGELYDGAASAEH